jgi:hypothetical protein
MLLDKISRQEPKEEQMAGIVKPAVGRLDNIIKELERLHHDAQDIFDAHIDFVRYRRPGIPFGVLKSSEIAGPAGNSLNYINALKIVRAKITGEAAG